MKYFYHSNHFLKIFLTVFLIGLELYSCSTTNLPSTNLSHTNHTNDPKAPSLFFLRETVKIIRRMDGGHGGHNGDQLNDNNSLNFKSQRKQSSNFVNAVEQKVLLGSKQLDLPIFDFDENKRQNFKEKRRKEAIGKNNKPQNNERKYFNYANNKDKNTDVLNQANGDEFILTNQIPYHFDNVPSWIEIVNLQNVPDSSKNVSMPANDIKSSNLTQNNKLKTGCTNKATGNATATHTGCPNNTKRSVNRNERDIDGFDLLRQLVKKDKIYAPQKDNQSLASKLDRLDALRRKVSTTYDMSDFSANDGRITTVSHMKIQEASDYSLLESLMYSINCTFETRCDWSGDDPLQGFKIKTATEVKSYNIGLDVDASNNSNGHFLFLQVVSTKKEQYVTSPLLPAPSNDLCSLEVHLHQGNMNASVIKIVGEDIQKTQWIIHEMLGNSYKSWQKYSFKVGRKSSDFKLLIEVTATLSPAHMALDNIYLADCYPQPAIQNTCSFPHEFRCGKSNVCINRTEVCDLAQDCPFLEDEQQNCDQVPDFGRCDFERDEWCGWYNDNSWLSNNWAIKEWTRVGGDATIPPPHEDHSYLNYTGHFLLWDLRPKHTGTEVVGGASSKSGIVTSIIFNPPPAVHSNEGLPHSKSCQVRFFYRRSGNVNTVLELWCTELLPYENVTQRIFFSGQSKVTDPDVWNKVTVVLPPVRHRYFLYFIASKVFGGNQLVALDDVTLSPECFGLNIPKEYLGSYNYFAPPKSIYQNENTHKGFVNESLYEFTTCNARGSTGPTQEHCSAFYNNTPVNVKVLVKPPLKGVQQWIVPHDGFYTIIAKGASGGKNSMHTGYSRGAVVRAVVELHKNEMLYILVGQKGGDARKSIIGDAEYAGVKDVSKVKFQHNGGGGGGASYVSLIRKRGNSTELVPILIAAGGGGVATVDREMYPSVKIDQTLNVNGTAAPSRTQSGSGASWSGRTSELTDLSDHWISADGQTLGHGAQGGLACFKFDTNGFDDADGNGGFGGGGGGCRFGGGGGGYIGGAAGTALSKNGRNGISFVVNHTLHRTIREAQHAGNGRVLIIPAIPGCECDFRCLAMDEFRSDVVCTCSKDWYLASDGKSCLLKDTSGDHGILMYIFVFLFALVLVALCATCFILYQRYQQRKSELHRQKALAGPELQLNRLRMQSDNMITEYNPNYQFGGVTYTLKDLEQIPRERLRLVKALGQGAFGEVYQGFYKARQNDTVEMPVAVKTLPEMSTQQAEMDFLMEALIMSKFNHPNIVHFIGVCFDKHPRFIILELLAGGDLKNFLRESRPKTERASTLTMKDLLLISVDVAKGCKYMEDNRFLHRDIAARNCLLTTKGPGRVVKIADFGMSRDIYRSDYYRKGGKAMLPIKWMPPEAFLDGIFTSKTDVWSYGVLLWEIMSLGYMPYTGCTNQQVMSLVTSGGRLESPASCPPSVYGIMTQCWHPSPEERPKFSQILERLDYCLQDPDVINTPLPVFPKVPSVERDVTIMRPNKTDNSYLQVPQNADYLVPKLTSAGDYSTSDCDSINKLVVDDLDSWETSFVLQKSKSTQPLLGDGSSDTLHSIVEASTDKSIQSEGKSPPHMAPNRTTPKINMLKQGVTLDASHLLKRQNGDTIPYANVTPKRESRDVDELRNNDSEISC